MARSKSRKDEKRAYLGTLLDQAALDRWRGELQVTQGRFARESLGMSEAHFSKLLTGRVALRGSGPSMIKQIASGLFDRLGEVERARTSIDEIYRSLLREGGTDVHQLVARVFGPEPAAPKEPSVEIEQIVEGVRTALSDDIRRLKEGGLPDELLAFVLERMGQRNLAPSDYGPALYRAVDAFESLEEEVKELRGDDPEVDVLRRKVQESIAARELHGVEDQLAQAEARDRRALARNEAALEARTLSLCHTLRLRALASVVQVDRERALVLMEEAISLLPKAARGDRGRFELETVDLLVDVGRLDDAEAALRRAAGLLAEGSREWVRVQLALGVITYAYGHLGKASEFLERAARTVGTEVAMYRLAALYQLVQIHSEALEERKRDEALQRAREETECDNRFPEYMREWAKLSAWSLLFAAHGRKRPDADTTDSPVRRLYLPSS